MLADYFFHTRILHFVKDFYVGVLNVRDYWMWFEWQYHGSPHVHGVVWLSDAPGVHQAFTSTETLINIRQQIINFIDSVVCTTNPAVLPDGSNASDAPMSQTNPHICNKSYFNVVDHCQDLKELAVTCQRHTQCSPAYCLRTKNGKQQCRFGYPKDFQPNATVSTADGDIVLQTARNDGLVNSYNPMQLSGWRANVDMQYWVSRR